MRSLPHTNSDAPANTAIHHRERDVLSKMSSQATEQNRGDYHSAMSVHVHSHRHNIYYKLQYAPTMSLHQGKQHHQRGVSSPSGKSICHSRVYVYASTQDVFQPMRSNTLSNNRNQKNNQSININEQTKQSTRNKQPSVNYQSINNSTIHQNQPARGSTQIMIPNKPPQSPIQVSTTET